MNYAEEIKQRLPAREVLERYGFHVDRSGFCRCPFHQGDNTGSLKVYDGSGGWHCFACGAGSSVIDFVMLHLGLPFGAAQEKLNEDFGLGLPIGSTLSAEDRARAAAEARKQKAEAVERERKLQALKDAEDRALSAFVLADKTLAKVKTGIALAHRDAAWYNYCEDELRLRRFQSKLPAN